MSDTQSYKSATSFTENALAALVSAAIIAAPFAVWFMGYPQ